MDDIEFSISDYENIGPELSIEEFANQVVDIPLKTFGAPYHHFIIKDDKGAYLYVAIQKKMYYGVPTLSITHIGIDQSRQGQGLFSNFLKTVENIADSQNINLIIESVVGPKLFSILKNKSTYVTQGEKQMGKTFHRISNTSTFPNNMFSKKYIYNRNRSLSTL